jgi:hypothetical protein
MRSFFRIFLVLGILFGSILPAHAAGTSIVSNLATDKSPGIVAALAQNPALSADLMAKFMKRSDLKNSLVLNTSLPADWLDAYVDSQIAEGHTGALTWAACNPATSAETLEKIWKKEPAPTLGSLGENTPCIARNPHTPEWILEAIFPKNGYQAKEGQPDAIKTYAGSNLVSMAPSADFLAANNVVNNPNAPQALLAKTNLSAINPNTSPELLAKLADDPYNEIRILVAGNVSTPRATLEKLAGDDDWWVRAQVAGNPSTPVRTLYELYRHADNKILQGTGHRHWNYELRYGLAGNPRTPLYILEELAKSTDIGTLSSLAANPKLPERIFESLLNGPDDYYLPVKQRLADNSKSPLSVLVMLTLSDNTQIRAMVAANPSADSSILEILSEDTEDWVRQEVAKNPNIFSVEN